MSFYCRCSFFYSGILFGRLRIIFYELLAMCDNVFHIFLSPLRQLQNVRNERCSDVGKAVFHLWGTTGYALRQISPSASSVRKVPDSTREDTSGMALDNSLKRIAGCS